MGNIGEDLVLLAIKRNGSVDGHDKLRFALAGSELVRLAEMRRIDIDHDGYIVVLDASPTGDLLTDLALAAIDSAIRAPRAKEWVARQRPTLINKYLERLAAVGVIRAEDRKVLGLSRARRWIIVDAARMTDAKGRLDAIALSTGPVTSEQAIYAGLVHAVGLDARLYPKRKNLSARARLEAIARKDEVIEMVDGAAASLNSAADASASAAADAALQTAMWSAMQSSVSATHHALVQHQTVHDGGFHHDGGGMIGGHHG